MENQFGKPYQPSPEEVTNAEEMMTGEQKEASSRREDQIREFSSKAAWEQAESMRSVVEESIRKNFKPEKINKERIDSVVIEVDKQLEIMYRECLMSEMSEKDASVYPHNSKARRGNVTLLILLGINVRPIEEKVVEMKKQIYGGSGDTIV